MADPYAIIAQYPNAGQAFTDAFNKGQQQNALAAFAMNPNSPQTAGAAARYDPGAVLTYRTAHEKAQGELGHQQLEDWRKYAGQLAKWADNPQKWDEAVDYMVSQGHAEAAQLKGKFSPALRANFMAQGGVSEDRPQIITPQPGGGAFQMTDSGPVPLVLPGDNAHAPGSPAQTGPITATGPNGQKIQFNPQSNAWEPIGGATASAPSAGFP